MAMILRSSRLRLTQAIYFGKSPSVGSGTVTSISDGNGILFIPNPIVGAGTARLTTLTSDWDAGNKDIFSRNAVNVLNVRAYGAGLGGGAVVDSAAIRQAITDAGSFGVVFFPVATYNVKPVNPGDTEIFLLTKACRLVFDYGATVLVDAATGANTDVFRYAPATDNDSFGMSVDGMFIVPQAGTPARHGFVADSSTPPSGAIRGPSITNCDFGALGGQSIVLSGAPATTSVYMACIADNYIRCGISLVNVGDSLTIERNILTGTKFGVEGSITSGANQIVISDNNITATGGISITSAVESCLSIFRNNIELLAGTAFSGANNAMVDLTGAALIKAPSIVGNNIQIQAVGTNVDCLRLGFTDRANVESNKFIVPAGSKGIVTTANAANTNITPDNFFMGAGTYLSLLGTTSFVANPANSNVGFGTTAEPNTQVAVNVPFVAGASEAMVTMQNGTTTLAGIYGVHDGANVAQGIEFWTSKENVGQFLAGRINNGGQWGLGTSSPTRQLDVNGAQRLRGVVAPAVSEANSGVMYFDSGLNKYRVSMNGSAYVDLVGSGGVTGSGVAGKLTYWTAATNLTDEPNITLGGAYTLDVAGDINLAVGNKIRAGGVVAFEVNDATDSLGVGTSRINSPTGGSTAIGHQALNVDIGVRNTAVGADANSANTGGTDNASVGWQALLGTIGGSQNAAIGSGAGASNVTGGNNVFVGYQADAAAGNLTNAVAIGYQASVAASDSMVLGNGSMNVGIRTSTPVLPLDVNGAIGTRHHDETFVNGANQDFPLTMTSFVRAIGPGAPFNIGGFANGVDGRVLFIRNTVAFQMTLNHLDAGSAASNQIITPTAAPVNCSVATLIFDDTSDKWILLSYF